MALPDKGLSLRNRIGVGSVTTVTVMTMNCRGSLKGCATLSGDERWCDGREHGEHKRDKERCRCEAQGAYLFPNVSPCSHSWPDGHDAPAVPYAAAGPTKLWHHASKASLSSSRSPSSHSATDCTASSGLSLPEATARRVSASPVTTRSGSGTEPCLASTLSPSSPSLTSTWNASPSIRNS